MRPGAVLEQRHPCVDRERRGGEAAFAADPQQLAARDQLADARRVASEPRHDSAPRAGAFEVVQQQQQRPVAEASAEGVAELSSAVVTIPSVAAIAAPRAPDRGPRRGR